MKTYHCLFFIFLYFVSCTSSPTQEKNEPYIRSEYFSPKTSGLQTGGVQVIPSISNADTFHVRTKTIGNNPRCRVLLLNGGPGCTHEYFECFENFLPAEGIEFIYYDQLGCGNSDNPNDSAYWDLNRYVEEVEQVRQALQLDSSNFFVLGHSWGGILAMQYALKYQQHLKGMIISNMMSDAVAYGKYADEVLGPQLAPAILEEIQALEEAKDFSNPRFMQLLNEHYYTAHICRLPLNEWPEPVNRSFSKINSSLYVTMQGPSEFGISGRLEKWDVSQQLKSIQTPTLVIGATYDTMDPKHMEWMAGQFPKGQFWLCQNGSHMCFYDDQQRYFEGLIPFLKQYSK